jgi:hypothetical protein
MEKFREQGGVSTLAEAHVVAKHLQTFQGPVVVFVKLDLLEHKCEPGMLPFDVYLHKEPQLPAFQHSFNHANGDSDEEVEQDRSHHSVERVQHDQFRNPMWEPPSQHDLSRAHRRSLGHRLRPSLGHHSLSRSHHILSRQPSQIGYLSLNRGHRRSLSRDQHSLSRNFLSRSRGHLSMMDDSNEGSEEDNRTKLRPFSNMMFKPDLVHKSLSDSAQEPLNLVMSLISVEQVLKHQLVAGPLINGGIVEEAKFWGRGTKAFAKLILAEGGLENNLPSVFCLDDTFTTALTEADPEYVAQTAEDALAMAHGLKQESVSEPLVVFLQDLVNPERLNCRGGLFQVRLIGGQPLNKLELLKKLGLSTQ